MVERIPRFSKKPKSPRPELSNARFWGPIGKYSYWEAQGPAREVFNKVGPELAVVLAQECDPVHSSSLLTFEIYMVGERPEKALPLIMFCCEKLGPREAAVMVVKES